MAKMNMTGPCDTSEIWSGLQLHVISFEADEPFLGEHGGGVILATLLP